MTSGIFHTISIDTITVIREARERRKLTDIEPLAQSIKRVGLIHPPVITREGVLVVGERRLTACRQLGWTTIPIQYVDELDEGTLRLIEIEENLRRVDIPWQDQVKFLQDYHDLTRDRSKSETEQRMTTALRLGLSEPEVREKLRISNEIAKAPDLAKIPEYSTVRGRVRRSEERQDERALMELQKAVGSPEAPKRIESIFTEDFNQWAPRYGGPRFNLIHCDFPYGINADKFNQGGSDAHGGYEDSAETFWRLVSTLGEHLSTLTTDSCHLVFWFGMRRGDQRLYEPIAQALDAQGWVINPIPLVWMKTDGSGIIPDPERGPRQIYETAFLGSRGDRKIIKAVANAYGAPVVRERHMSEKPESVLRHFFQMLVDENTIMLDPTCGSGSSLRAAESLGARFTTGLEVNPEFADRARLALDQSRKLRAAAQAEMQK